MKLVGPNTAVFGIKSLRPESNPLWYRSSCQLLPTDNIISVQIQYPFITKAKFNKIKFEFKSLHLFKIRSLVGCWGFTTVPVTMTKTVGVGHSRWYCNTGYDQSQGRRPSTLKCIGPISKGDIEPNHPSNTKPIYQQIWSAKWYAIKLVFKFFGDENVASTR